MVSFVVAVGELWDKPRTLRSAIPGTSENDDEACSDMATEDTEGLSLFTLTSHSLPDDGTAEGYDNEFIEALDNKYECPICLMCLREPQQTDCGHRFCKNCIKKWLGGKERKCPACNEILIEAKVYPDNFAKREILTLIVKCHFSKLGCDYTGQLKTVLWHQAECRYRTVPCENNCGECVMVINMQEHLQKECSRRMIECISCRQSVSAINLVKHQRSCAISCNSCEHCGDDLSIKAGRNMHLCTGDSVVCKFRRFGCLKKDTELSMETHMKEAVGQHLLLLSSATGRLMDDHHNYRVPTHELKALEEQLASLVIARQESTENEPKMHESDDEDDLKKPKLKPSHSFPYATGDTSLNSKVTYHSGEYLVAADNNVASELRNRVADQTQHILELTSKVNLLESQLQEARRELRDSRMEMKTRCCGGSYIWRLHNYTRLREESRLGAPNCVLHSPGFYTSFSGYQFCMRLNLNGVENVQGTHLSLFIHLMKSENDDILTWPFSGKITLSILDQNDIASKRNHITETLIAKPGLAAFQRPATVRNHKGFGYMEFAPLAYLERPESCFIKDDTLIVRADIRPT